MTNGASLHAFYNGLGATGKSSSLPNQYLPSSQKKDKFKKRTMDALEIIGLSQLAENIEFRDYYKMTEGRLVYSDYGLEDGILSRIKELGDEVAIPTFVKHYDIIGILVNQLVGEYADMKDNFTIGSFDEVSDNEFISERTRKLHESVAKSFDLQLKRRLAEMGVNPEQEEFSSEEEKQQYLALIQKEKDSIKSPSDIKMDMQKNFKTNAAEWAEHVIEADQERFYLDTLDSEEMKDYLLTGRYFRNYYVGYDFYKPERWSPIQTFFSKDLDSKYPQNGEYVGRITYMSPAEVTKRWGHVMKPSDIKLLNKGYDSSEVGNDGGKSFKSILGSHFVQPQTIPYASYYERELGLQIQDAMDIPMGHYNGTDPDGNDIEVPAWLSEDFNHNYSGYRYSSILRDDISVRTDLLQITEAYFRSQKRMWLINTFDKDGLPIIEEVTDDILPEFIKENEIKKITTKTAQEIVNDVLEPNTMYEFYIPEVWKGIKINNGNSFLTDPIYLEVEPLPYQIKGESNTYDVLLPVGGIIETSMAQKLRPYQVGYNICMNQIFNFLEKEIGTFFLFDINFLPSDYKDMGNSEDALLKLRDLAQSVGFVPLDTKKQNLEGANPQMNTFMTQSITYDVQIKNRIELASYYQQKALEQIGITPQRLGNPGKYETATGVEQGTKASYTQTQAIFGSMAVARKKSMELHLAIAQYCQKEYLDVDMVFTKSDGDRHFINLNDKDFPLRRLGLIPTNNPKSRRTLEKLRETIIQTNTIGNDIQDLAEVFSADTMLELVAIGRKNRIEKQKELEAERAHEQQLVDKQIEAAAAEGERNRLNEDVNKDKDREAKLLEKKIEAFGRAVDKESNQLGLETLERISNLSLKEQQVSSDIEVKNKTLESKDKEFTLKNKIELEKINIKLKEIAQKDKKMNNDRFIAVRNKN